MTGAVPDGKGGPVPEHDEILEMALAIADGAEVDWRRASSVAGADGRILDRLVALAALARRFRRVREGEGGATEPPPEVPFRWGHLEVLELLGRGSFGEVYRARDPSLEREVALKLVHGHVERDRFLDEARRLARVRHPHVVTVHGAERHGRPGLWTELIAGSTLERWVAQQGTLGAREAAGVGTDLCRALAAVHGAGLVHGDVKPANVMREEGGRIVLMDFGAGRATGELGIPAHVTPATLAPEVLEGGEPTVASDLHALGGVLYFLLTGRLPATAAPVSRRGAQWGAAVAPLRDLRPDLPSELVAAVERALDPDPGRRFGTAGTMERALLAAAAAPAESSDPVPARARVTPPDGRAARALFRPLAIGLLAAVAGGSALLVLWPGTGERPDAPPPQPALRILEQRLLADLPAAPRAPAFSPDGTLIAVVSGQSGSEQVWVKPLSGGRALRVTSGAPVIAGPRWTPAGEVAYAVAGEGIWVVPPLGGEPRQLHREGRNFALSPDGARLAYTSGGWLWIAELGSGEQRRVAEFDQWAFGGPADSPPAFAPDGTWIAAFAVEDGPLGDLWRIPVAGGAPRRLTADLVSAGGPAVSPDGRLVVFWSDRAGSRNLWQVPSGGGQPEPLTTGPGEHGDPAISADGRQLLYLGERLLYRLQALDLASGRRRIILERRTGISSARASPSGDRVSFFQMLGTQGAHVFTVGIDGSRLLQLTRGDEELNIAPSWSHDGRWLYYFRHHPAPPSLRRIPSTGGPSEVVLEPASFHTHSFAVPSPDGRRLAFSGRGSEERPTVLDLATNERLVLPSPRLHYLRWTPDGLGLLGGRLDGAIVRCEVMTQASCRELVSGAALAADWTPDQRGIVFLRPAATPQVYGLAMLDLASGRERDLGEVGPLHPLTSDVTVTPEGEAVFVEIERGVREIWLAALR